MVLSGRGYAPLMGRDQAAPPGRRLAVGLGAAALLPHKDEGGKGAKIRQHGQQLVRQLQQDLQPQLQRVDKAEQQCRQEDAQGRPAAKDDGGQSDKAPAGDMPSVKVLM